MAQEEQAKPKSDPLCCTYDQFKEAIKDYDPKKEFRPSLLCGCACPEGSINIIAARPAGGKTSSLINIVRETLTSEKDKERKILYVNLEMGFRPILINLHLSFIYGFVATAPDQAKLQQLKETKYAFYLTANSKNGEGESLLNNEQPADKDLKRLFVDNYHKAADFIKNAMNNGNLQVYNGIGQEFEAVIKKIGECPKKSIILIDYMQRLPVPEGFQSAQRYLQIQKSSEVLLKTAIENQLIVIAGAQLKREDNNKGQETAPSMDSIRESGDIEQDAHNVVILNKDYAEVAKSRESGETAKKMNIKAVKQFVFWETNGEGEYDDSPARKNLKHVKKPELENSLKTFKPAPKNSTNI
jgi:hypothetical protein